MALNYLSHHSRAPRFDGRAVALLTLLGCGGVSGMAMARAGDDAPQPTIKRTPRPVPVPVTHDDYDAWWWGQQKRLLSAQPSPSPAAGDCASQADCQAVVTGDASVRARLRRWSVREGYIGDHVAC